MTKALELAPAIEVNADYAYSYWQRGDFYLQIGWNYRVTIGYTNAMSSAEALNMAVADFTRAIELNQYKAEYYNARGLVYYQTGELDLATIDLEKFVTSSSGSDEIQYARQLLGQIAVAQLPQNPTYQENFSDPSSGWPIESYPDKEYAYEDGEYHIRVKATYNFVPWAWISDAGKFTDFALEIDARLVSGSSGSKYGVVFRVEDNDHFYRFMIREDGYYTVSKWDNDKWFTLQNWTKSDFINQGNSTNHLLVVCRGSQIKVYVNGYYLDTITDNSFTRGYVGVMVSSGETDVDAAFDNIKVYRLD